MASRLTLDNRARAANPSTPAEEVAVLARLADPRTREAAWGNPNLPRTLLLRVGPGTAHAVATNPVLPLLLLEDPGAFASLDGRQWTALLAPAELPSSIRLHAARSCPRAKLATASSPHTPSVVLEQLASDGDRRVRLRVAGNPSAPAHVLEELGLVDAQFAAEVVKHARLDIARAVVEAYPVVAVTNALSRNPRVPVPDLARLGARGQLATMGAISARPLIRLGRGDAHDREAAGKAGAPPSFRLTLALAALTAPKR